MEIPDEKMYALQVIDKGNYLHFIVTGQDSERTSELYWTEVFTLAKQKGKNKILVEEALEGNTTVIDTYIYIDKLTAIADRNAIIAFYDRYSSSINIFAETVAQNRGGRVKVFDSLEAAEKWLVQF